MEEKKSCYCCHVKTSVVTVAIPLQLVLKKSSRPYIISFVSCVYFTDWLISHSESTVLEKSSGDMSFWYDRSVMIVCLFVCD